MKETVLAVREMDWAELKMIIAGLDVIVDLYQHPGKSTEQLTRAILLRAHYIDLLELHIRFYGGNNG
jgi:hypothetical protein